MAIVKKISELTPKGSNLGTTDLLIVGVSNGVDHDLKTVTGAQVLGSAISQTITNGVTSSAPSQNAVFDALALKADVSPVLPATIVDFDTTDPNTPGTVFTPDDQLNEEALYVSSVDFSQWTSDGLVYDTYTAPTVLATEFYLQGTTIDAGSNKTASIYRNGSISATSFNTKKQLTYTKDLDANKWWKILDYSIANDFDSDSFKLQLNEMNASTGVGKSVILDVILKRQDPNVYLNVNASSDISSLDLANLDVLYNSTTKKITFYYRITTTYTRTNWLILNAKSDTSSYITWYGTLIGASLSGETNNTITTKTIALNKVNGAFTLPTTAPTAGQVLGYSSSGVSDWVNSSTPKVQTVTSSATVTPVSTNDLVIITSQATGLTLANPTGTFTEGQALMIRIKDNATARTIAFDTNYRAIGVTLPTTTVISKTLYLGIIYNSTDSKWDIVGLNQQS